MTEEYFVKRYNSNSIKMNNLNDIVRVTCLEAVTEINFIKSWSQSLLFIKFEITPPDTVGMITINAIMLTLQEDNHIWNPTSIEKKWCIAHAVSTDSELAKIWQSELLHNTYGFYKGSRDYAR